MTSAAFIGSLSATIGAATRPMSSFTCNQLTLDNTTKHPAFVQPATTRSTTVKSSLASELSVLASVLPFSLFPNASPSPATPAPPTLFPTQITRAIEPHGDQPQQRHKQANTNVHQPLAIVASATNSSGASKYGKYVPKIQQRISFYISEFLMWHPGAKILSLFVFTVLAMYCGQFLYRLADPDKKEAQSPFWHSVRAIANPLEDDWENNSLRATSIFLASFGMVIFAILIGTVTDSVQTAVENANGQNSPIVLQDHLLVLGWSNIHTPNLLQNTQSKNIVVLSSTSSSSFQEQQQQQDEKRIYYRPGSINNPSDLEKVAAWNSEKILIFDDDSENNNDVIAKVIALKKNLQTYNGDIIIQVNNEKCGQIIRKLMDKNQKYEIVNAHDLIGRFAVQAAQQPGLNDIVDHLMNIKNANQTFDIQNVNDIAPRWIGKQLNELHPLSIDGYIVCGVVDDQSNEVMINVGSSLGTGNITKDTKLVILGNGNVSTNNSGDNENLVLSSEAFERLQQRLGERKAHMGRNFKDNVLILGWRNDMSEMLSEFNTMLPKGSTVTIASDDIPIDIKEQIKAKNIRDIKIKTVKQSYNTYDTLSELLHEKDYHSILLLTPARLESTSASSTEDNSSQSVSTDSKSLSTLVFINDIVKNMKDLKRPIVTAEFVNESISKLAQYQGLANIMLPQTLGAKIAAQAIQHPKLNQVWTELLSQQGREFYLKSISNCEEVKFGTSKMLSFSDVVNSISRGDKGDIVIGYIPKFGAGTVRINPTGEHRHVKRIWHPEDVLIVLANDS